MTFCMLSSFVDDMFLGWPFLLSEKTLQMLTNNSTRYDFVINHLVYEEHLLAPLFREEPMKVTIVRQPCDQLRSSFNYYDILREENDLCEYLPHTHSPKSSSYCHTFQLVD